MMSLNEYATGLTGWKWREIEEDGRLKENEEEGQCKKRNTTSNSEPSKEEASDKNLAEKKNVMLTSRNYYFVLSVC
jgi:hypothetical protein